jgi:dipeptidyl aminopeptidase/acylaminoacyl peptidase
MKRIEGISYGKGGVLDVYLPETPCFDVFLYFHGGGLESGSRHHADVFAPELTDAGICVVSADYRMYPSARYPDFIEDAAEAVAWTVEHIGEYGQMQRLIVGGSSAGGYLSMMLCMDRRYLGKHGIAPTEINAWIHDAGQPTAHFNVLRERGIDSRRVIVDESAPLFYIGQEESYSPMLFVVSDKDMKNRYEQTMLTLSTLKHFGFEDVTTLRVMEGKHCAYVERIDPDGTSAFAQIVLSYLRTL